MLHYLTGFEFHSGTADLTADDFTDQRDMSVSTAQPGTGLRSLLFSNSTAYLGRALAGAAHATQIVGFRHYRPGAGNGVIMSFLGDSGATHHVTIQVTTTGEIKAYRGTTASGTLLGTSIPGVVGTTRQDYIVAKVVLHDSAGAVRVAVNGRIVLDLSGIDTKNGGTLTTIDTIYLGGIPVGTTNSFYADDLIMMNGSGSANNDLFNEARVETVRPNGNGNSSQLLGSDGNSVDNYLLVDETIMSTGTADYVESSTDNQKDTYAFPSLPEASATIIGARVVAYAEKTDAGLRSLALVTRSGGSDVDGTDHTLSTSYDFVADLQDVNPVTVAAWTLAEINAAEWGVKVRP